MEVVSCGSTPGISTTKTVHLEECGWSVERGADLGSDEEIPTLNEMSTDVPGWLTDNLHSDVVPTSHQSNPLDSQCTSCATIARKIRSWCRKREGRLTKAFWEPSFYRSYPQRAYSDQSTLPPSRSNNLSLSIPAHQVHLALYGLRP